jgi:hypothetical protein
MSKPRSPLAALTALALATALVVGCGGDDPTAATSTTATGEEALADYSAQMQEELGAFASEFSALGQEAANPTSVADYAEAVTAIQDRLGETVSNLEAISPPSELADIHERLITTFEDLQDGYAPIADAAESGDKRQIQQAVLDLQQTNADFQTEFSDLSAQAERLGAPIEGPSSSSESTTTSP